MFFLALSAHQFGDIYFAVIAGLKLFAVVIVADATYSMAMSFCKNHLHKLIAVLSTVALIVFSQLSSQIIVLIAAAALGWFILNLNYQNQQHKSVKIAWLPLGLFTVLLLVSLQRVSGFCVAPFYQTGAMVFGGGRCVRYTAGV